MNTEHGHKEFNEESEIGSPEDLFSHQVNVLMAASSSTPKRSMDTHLVHFETHVEFIVTRYAQERSDGNDKLDIH